MDSHSVAEEIPRFRTLCSCSQSKNFHPIGVWGSLQQDLKFLMAHQGTSQCIIPDLGAVFSCFSLHNFWNIKNFSFFFFFLRSWTPFLGVLSSCINFTYDCCFRKQSESCFKSTLAPGTLVTENAERNNKSSFIALLPSSSCFPIQYYIWIPYSAGSCYVVTPLSIMLSHHYVTHHYVVNKSLG